MGTTREAETYVLQSAMTIPKPQGSASPGGPERLRSCYANHKAVSRVLPMYVDDLPMQVAQITSRLIDGDVVALRRLVHGLRGSGGGYGFPEITRLASIAEGVIDAGSDRAAVKIAVTDLIDTLRRVEGYDVSKESAAAA